MNITNNTFTTTFRVCADNFAGTPLETRKQKYVDATIASIKEDLAKTYKKAIASYSSGDTFIEGNGEVTFDIEIKTKDVEIFTFEAKLSKIDSNGIEYTDDKAKSIAFQLCEDVRKYLVNEGKEVLNIETNFAEFKHSPVLKAEFIVA